MEFDYYFAYGSNLSRDFLNERLKNGEWIEDGWQKNGNLEGKPPDFLGVYRLDGYEFGYTLREENETTGNIIRKEGSAVFGALYRISKVQLDVLDKEENAPEQYTKTLVKVNRVCRDIFKAPQSVEAFAYVGNKNYYTTDVCPDPRYVELLLKAAEELSLPQSYVDQYFLLPILQTAQDF